MCLYTRYCGVSDTTLIRLIDNNILAVEQVAPYAPLEIKRTDLESKPVASILERLKATGKVAKPLGYYATRYNNPRVGMALAYLSGGYLMKAIAEHFSVYYATVSPAA